MKESEGRAHGRIDPSLTICHTSPALHMASNPQDFAEEKKKKVKLSRPWSGPLCPLADFSICKGGWQGAMKGELTLLWGPHDLGLLTSEMMSSIDDFC